MSHDPEVKHGGQCWDSIKCKEGVAYKLTGPLTHEFIGAMRGWRYIQVDLQVTTYLCAVHAIQMSAADPTLIVEEF